jgi:hypothetical protein
MEMATGASLWSLAGSVYALAGAALIWAGVVGAQRPSALLAATSSSDASSQFDARIGAALLTIGFFLQATGAVGGAKLHGPAVFMLVALAAGLLFYGVGKDLIAEAPVEADAPPVPALEAPQKRILIAQAESGPDDAAENEVRPTPLRQIN